MKKLQYIEIARGIAAILVVLHHATLDAPAFYDYRPFDNLFYFGMAGIDFFFVLSGFIIYYVHSDDNGTWKSIKDYIIKRLIRVYPLFLVVSTSMLIAYLLLPQWSPIAGLFSLEYLTTSFLLLPSSTPPLLSVSWTLVHEIFFYMLFILIILNKKIGVITFILWALMILSYNLFFQDVVFPFSFYLSKYNFEFLLGVLVAFLIKSDISFKIKNLALPALIVGLVVFLLNGVNVDYNLIQINGFYTTMIYGLAGSNIVFGLALLPSLEQVSRLFKMLLLLGAASYSIYLIHNPLQSVLHRIIRASDIQTVLHPNLIFIAIVMFCLLAGIILHILIERPILNYLRKRFL